jgi:L-fuconate dehydratase
LTESEALALLQRNFQGRSAREEHVRAHGFPAYTTSPGWIGYGDDQIAAACGRAVADGWEAVKIKVGRDASEDVRRCAIAREALGPSRRLMIDANQSWRPEEATAAIARLAHFDLWWVEEPTHPDDVQAHARIAREIFPTRVACGEHVPNAVVFKQFLTQGAIGIAQVDACRSGGVNDVIATLLLAAKLNVPVCPHAGGVGLCELVQHLSIFDYIAVGASMDDRTIEYVDHLHEHFIDPAIVRNGRYVVPTAPGFSSAIHPSSIERFTYPGGAQWRVELLV